MRPPPEAKGPWAAPAAALAAISTNWRSVAIVALGIHRGPMRTARNDRA